MALFNKIFFQSTSSSSSSSSSASSTSSSTSSANSNKQSIHSKNYISQFPFHGGQVRILLFRECDSRGRRLLFDSNALQKVSLKDFEIKLTNNTHNINEDNISIKSDINAGKQPLKGHVNGFVETSDGFLYRHNRPTSMDIPSIGEMVFGALAMSFRGTALKVHWLRSPTRMLCSQVFLSPTNVTNNSITPHHISADHLTPRNSITSDHGSVDGFSMNSFCIGRKNSNVSEHIGERPYCTNPLDVPDASFDNGIPRYSATYSTGDSGYSGGTTSNDQWTITTSSLSYQYSTRSSIGSAMSDAESVRKFSLDSSFFPSTTNSNVSSDGSLQRRISRNLLTSFENQNSLNDFIGFLSDNNFHGAGTGPQTAGGSEGCVAPQYRRASCTNESRSNPEIGRRRDISHFHKASRRAKLGLAVCITMSESFEEEMELFCSEHIALLESMLGRLRLSSEKAYINHKDFLQIMVHAWQATTQWVVDLFTAPRISVPVWLSITTSGSKHSKTVADRFIRDLCLLLSVADTKDTNFFVSTVLTAILTHHLGWVSTISNINSPSKSRAAAIEQRAKLLEVSQKYPYNVLWAQMGDLYGAVGIPPKLSRTVIYGTEKLHTERLLNILTYFIRCGEVRRSTKKEVFNKDRINDLIMNQTNDQSSAKGNSFSNSIRNSFSSTISNSASSSTRSLGLTRNATCKTNLNSLSSTKGNLSSDQTDTSAVNIHKKNDIPNVLAFRESRLVQQELRIGNFSMDPGITKSSLKNRKEDGIKRDRIKLTITTPENVEVIVEPSESDESNIEDVVEAIEIESCEGGGDQRHKKHASFWSLPVKEGLSWGDLNKLPNLPMNRKLEKRSTSCNVLREIEKSDIDEYSELKPIGDKHISLSVLITENSVGKSERLTWGIEPFKEAISLEEEQHFEIQQKIVEKERGITKDKNSVVFVLGDNEALVNIKRSNEDLSEVDSTSQSTVAKKPMCPHHHHKKHSGVKFDFAQYPQIYANYMKSKNLSDCDFMEKPQKLENLHLYGDSSSLCSAGTSSLPPVIKEEEVLTDYCEICQNSSASKSYQTPSNATELEFDTDDDHSVYNNQSFESLSGSRTLVESRNVKVKRGVKHSEVNVIVLPVPGTKEQEMEEDAVARCDMKLKAGFIPSLFLNMSDHYVSDMVLQGTSAPPHQWEANIREDLTLATHSASLISARAENVAVIANMDKWDVKIISPQNQMLPYSNVMNGPVGMSQLVASMLETVYTMNNSGISSYDCLSFLESKLQEIYMHSEALAAFLLETDFCSLNAVTSALNLTENDVPLLLSVASIHTPQISKKCGISFR